jgi:hypothetical protein
MEVKYIGYMYLTSDTGCFLSDFFEKFFYSNIGPDTTSIFIVRDHKGLGCNVALFKCTLDSGKPKGGWDFGREGTGGQMGNRGS